MGRERTVVKKYVITALLVAAFSFSFVGCAEEKPRYVSVDEVEISLVSTEKGVTLSWQNVKDVDFSVYKSGSRFGDYTLVGRNPEGNKFTDAEHYCYYKVVLSDGDGKTLKTFSNLGEEIEMFGQNVYVFSPDDDVSSVKNLFSAIHSRTVDDEFSNGRYSFLLKPGEYDDDIGISVGYYTTVFGLGTSPTDTSVSSLSCLNRGEGNGAHALINFWRGAENLSVRSNTTWAVSQGVSLRAVDISGNLNLHDSGGYASGGMLADSRISGQVNSGSQQQWLSRNCEWSSWSGNVWNMCFSGVNKPPVGSYPSLKYTVEDASSIREKPFLTFDKTNGYRIAVPALREDRVGCSWTGGGSRIESFIPEEQIYFARSDRDTADTVNAAISKGKSVVFTPGVYSFDKAVEVDCDDAVILGLGLATITPTAGNACLTVGDSVGVTVAGILFDAGETKSDVLVSVGTENSTTVGASLYDCYFRVGGSYARSAADASLVIYGYGTTCDNLWIWRADHGPANDRGYGVGWDVNDGETGVKIYGDNVTAYALMAEHYKGHNVEWYGEGGKLFFYQSEIAYDVPSQAEWMDGERKGFSSIMVDENVNSFSASGLGIYSNFHNGGIVLDSAITAPNKSGIAINHIATVRLNGNGAINHVVNDFGGAVGAAGSGTTLFTDKFIPE
ncbi:MAG: hypothetical protein J1F39_00865 [Clostridiales bacterium]|nr:hypothetical protein [Clostridiales bacterium]